MYCFRIVEVSQLKEFTPFEFVPTTESGKKKCGANSDSLKLPTILLSYQGFGDKKNFIRERPMGGINLHGWRTRSESRSSIRCLSRVLPERTRNCIQRVPWVLVLMAYSFEDCSVITCVQEIFYFSSWLQAKHTQTNNRTRYPGPLYRLFVLLS